MNITLEHVTYSIGSKTILEDISLQINPGELHILLGRNGAGKSSLFRILTNEIAPNSGTILFFEKPIQNYPKKEIAKLRAVLSQETLLNFPYTAREIVSFGRFPYQSSDSETETITNTNIARTNACHLKEQNFFTLSGGEKQKIQFARVLTQLSGNPPKLLFMDEPIASLDLPTQFQLLRICKELTKEGFGVFMIIHDLNLASQFADKVTVLYDGKIRKSGEPSEVLSPTLIEECFGFKSHLLKHNQKVIIIPELM